VSTASLMLRIVWTVFTRPPLSLRVVLLKAMTTFTTFQVPDPCCSIAMEAFLRLMNYCTFRAFHFFFVLIFQTLEQLKRRDEGAYAGVYTFKLINWNKIWLFLNLTELRTSNLVHSFVALMLIPYAYQLRSGGMLKWDTVACMFGVMVHVLQVRYKFTSSGRAWLTARPSPYRPVHIVLVDGDIVSHAVPVLANLRVASTGSIWNVYVPGRE
jgi:hypothetical protein